MRFKKASLVAASLLLSSIPALAADIRYGWVPAPGVTVINDGGVLAVAAGDTAILNDGGRSGMINGLTGGGNLVKEGSGILRDDGFYHGYTANSGATFYGAEGGLPNAANRPGVLSSPEFLPQQGALTGSITIKGGTFEVSGRVNQWVQLPGNMGATPGGWASTTGYVAGASGTVLANAGTQLTFTNTGLNVSNGVATELGGAGGVMAYRYNVIHNVKSGANNNIVNTTFSAGVDSSYRIAIIADNTADAIAGNAALAALGAAGNSIGKLSGAGSVIKYGNADLKILGESERGFGAFTIANGSVTLASTGGAALATATAVNLAGTDSLQGHATMAIYKENAGPGQNPQANPNDNWINAVTPGTGTGVLIVQNNQTIRNLQADFAQGATGGTLVDAISNAASSTAVGEAVIAGTGRGSSINIGANTLTIRQDRDGVYGGNIVATAGGTIVKQGDATLALLLGTSTDALIRIEAGTLLANAQGLGTGQVTLAGGSLSIFQNNAGALKTTLSGAGNLDIIANAELNNGTGAVQLNNTGSAGTISISVDQAAFTGTVNVRDGVVMELSTVANNALRNLESLTLHAGTGAQATTLRITNGTHSLNRFSGDAGTRIDLRQGELTVRQAGATPLAYDGAIVGTGNLIQDGGTWSINGGETTTTGALVVRNGGALTQTGTAGLASASGLVLSEGSSFIAGGKNTAVGALFGQAGSVVDLGAGTLTVGIGANRAANLATELNSGTPLSTVYLGTSTTAADLGGAGIGAFDTSLVAAELSQATHTGIAGATEAFLIRQYAGSATAAADAATLAFAGSIRGTGGLTKIGGETLFLTGVNTYTGATQIQGGTLAADWDALAGTSGITVSAGATFALNADAASGNGTFDRAVTGAGTIAKVGANNLVFTGSLADFTGGISVREGRFEVTSSGTFGGQVDVAAGGTLAYNLATDSTGTATIVNNGVLEKSGAGRLQLGTYSGGGSIVVNAGTLAVTNFPVALQVASGATFESTLTGTVTTSVVTTGTGTVSLIGDTTPGAPASVLVAGANNLFNTATLALSGGLTFDLNSTNQTLGGLSGDTSAMVNLNSGTLDVAADSDSTYNGGFSGMGLIVKSGNGVLTLGTVVNQNWQGQVTVQEGTLVATAQAIGSNNVTLAGGTFALHNADATTPTTYASSVSGTGILAKTGVGEVFLSQGVSGVVGEVSVREGRLTTVDGGTNAVFSSVTVASGATFQVNMSGDRLHDGTSAYAVTGAGDLAVSGPHTLTLANGVGYTGLTQLLDGAKLAFNNTDTLGGLAGATGTLVTLSGDLTVNQARDAAYSGNFAGTGELTVGGPGVLDLSAAGVAGELAGIPITITVSQGGSVKVAANNTLSIANEGDLGLNVDAGQTQQYLGSFTGSGTLSKTGAGTLVFGTASIPYHLGNAGAFTIRDGVVGGNFSTAGALIVASGGTLAPGNSPGVVSVGSDFTLNAGGTLAIEVNGTTSDRVEVTGAASLAGIVSVSHDNTPGASQVTAGTQYTIITTTNGVTGAFSNASSTGLVTLSVTEAAAVGVSRMHFGIVGNDVVMTAVGSLADVAGFEPHDGTSDLVALLNAGTAHGTDLVPTSVQTAIDGIWGSSINAAINNLTPLGFASEYAMAQDGEARRQSLLHDRLEQRRYDRGSLHTYQDSPWEAFVVGSGAFANNDSKTDTPTFNYNTFGGMVGLDRKLNDDLLVGGAVSYDNGRADIHNGGGRVDMNRMAFTGFVSTQISSRWYVDAGVNFGVGLFDTKRSTVVGEATGDNVGFSGGFHVESGTIVVLAKDLHLTPYVGAAYTHHEFGSIDEDGSDAALDIDSWSNDSLRLKVGTGLGWFLPTAYGRMKLGLDVAYSHEVLDTESKFNSRFKNGGAAFSTKANALPDGAISISPSVGIQLDEVTSVSVGYSYEYGMDSRTYQSLNFAVRKRF